jgi:hypothetical protein
VILVLVAVLAAGCGVTLKSSGNLQTQDYNFEKFSRVEVGSAFEFEITRADTYSIAITADDNLFEHIQVDKSGDTLKISCKTLAIIGPVTLKVTITMPQLNDLNISGASHGAVSGFSTTDDTEFTVSGASRLTLAEMALGDVAFDVSEASQATGTLTAKKLDLRVSGASEAELSGAATDVTVEASGASRVHLDGLAVNNANVNLSGASTGTVNLSGRLDAEVTGASRLEYIGTPTMGNIETSGASTLSKK